MRYLSAVIWVWLLGGVAQAGALEHMFKKLGSDSNQTDPRSFQDQAVGHYTLGGLAVRQKNKIIQPFNIRLPSGIGQGSCGDMDLHFGGISFMQGNDFKEMLQKVARGLPSYGLQLAMKTYAPQVEGLMSDLRHHLQMINNMTLDDCRMRQAMFDAVLPKQGAMRETLCQDIKRRSGDGDFFGAMSSCRSEEQQHAHKSEKKYDDLLSGEYNLVWKVLQRIDKYKGDIELAEFIMSVTGTVISRKTKGDNDKSGSTYELVTNSPQADDLDFAEAHLDGGKVYQLACDEHKECLKPRLVEINITGDKSMTSRVINVVNGLKSKYLEGADTKGNGLTPEERSILGDAYSVPIFKYIQVAAAANSQVVLMKDAARYIAISLILSRFDTVSSEIMTAVETLESIQLDQTAIKAFKKNLQNARTRVQAMLKKSDFEGIWRLNQHIRALENIIEASTDS